MGAFAGRCPSQADPGVVIKRAFGNGVALIRGGALWWTRRRLLRAASRHGRELWSPWPHRGPSGDDDEEAGSAPGARAPGRWRWCSRTRLGRWLRSGGTLRFGTGRWSGVAVEPQGVTHAARLGAPGGMPQAEVADLVEAPGQNMLEIAAQELGPRDPAGPGPSGLAVAVLKADGFLIQVDDAPVGERALWETFYRPVIASVLAAIASGVTQTVRLPRRRSAASYSAQFSILYRAFGILRRRGSFALYGIRALRVQRALLYLPAYHSDSPYSYFSTT